MSQPTERYKRSFTGSVGSGMKSVFGGEGRRYYVLEHKVSTKYHKAGESQRIIVDQIELGRDPKCQVRFDEMFGTVSRRHAAIVKDGDNWKLVQLSKTNSTYLNGQRIGKEWYLQNGDEIQLSTNGPKLGFIVPGGEKGLVKSIGMTARLNLFRQQALRPYKQAITVMICFLVLCCGVGGYFLYDQHKGIGVLTNSLADASAKLADVIEDNSKLGAILSEEREKRHRDSIEFERRMKKVMQYPALPVAKLMEPVKSSVYFIVTECFMKIGDNAPKHLGSSSGTGFLLEDGRFVTARHCVEAWLFGSSLQANIFNETYKNVTVWSEITAFGAKGDDFKLKSTDFTIDRSLDVIIEVGPDDNGNQQKMRLARYLEIPDQETGQVEHYGTKLMGGKDWAYAKIGKKGTIKPNGNLSISLTAGDEVHVLGFPAGLGAGDGPNRVEPIYNKMSVARNGLNNEGCIMVSQGVAHGNSGGPVFIVKDGQVYVIAIVSKLESATQQYNDQGVIIQQQQQYDQLVPIKNIQQ